MEVNGLKLNLESQIKEIVEQDSGDLFITSSGSYLFNKTDSQQYLLNEGLYIFIYEDTNSKSVDLVAKINSMLFFFPLNSFHFRSKFRPQKSLKKQPTVNFYDKARNLSFRLH